jgi:hypothetical protein
VLISRGRTFQASGTASAKTLRCLAYLSQLGIAHILFFILKNFTSILLLYWGYTVTFTKVLIIYLS